MPALRPTLPLIPLAVLLYRNELIETNSLDAECDAVPIQSIRGGDARVWGEILRSPNAYLFHFFELARFELPIAAMRADPGSAIRFVRLPAADDRTVQHLWRNQVLPYLWSAQGYAVLHVSAVAWRRQIVAFAGVSGAGKSTLATALLQSGARLFSDDGLRVRFHRGSAWAWPGSRAVRLWPDSADALRGGSFDAVRGVTYSSKAHFELRETARSPTLPGKLRCIYVLDGREDVQTPIDVQPVVAQDAFQQLARHSFVLDPHESVCAEMHFNTLSDLAAGGYVKRLRYPRSYARLRDVVQAVHFETMNSCTPPSA